jgi:type IV pilus assembly protein PilY1
MGFTFGTPIVGKLADGTWVVLLTSGYNNTDGIGRLYVLNAYTGSLRFVISTGVGTAISPSGLAKISAWVDNGLQDNTIQRVYGGDLYGNLWRFDVNDSIPGIVGGRDAFKLAFFQVGPYFQPITTKPELGLVDNKAVIFVGTGRYLGGSDLLDLNQQSLYALRDDLTATPYGNPRTSGNCATGIIQAQTITVIDPNTRTTSQNPIDFANGDCGWYVDFNPGGGSESPGERVNVDPRLQLGVLAVATNIPEQSICTVGGTSFLYFFDYAKGTFVSTVTGNVVGTRISSSIAVGLNTYRLPDGRVVTTVTTSDDKHPVFGNPSNPLIGSIGRRVLWRELLQ